MSKHTSGMKVNGGRHSEEQNRLPETVTGTTTMPSGSVSRMVRLNWKLIALITLGVAGLSWIASAVQPARYRAGALVAVAPLAGSLQANEVLRGVEVLERRTVVATVAALVSTAATRSQAAAGAGYEIGAAVLPNTNLFRVEVEGPDPGEAAAIANRVPELLSGQTQAIFRYYRVMMVSPAAAPASAFSPRPARAIASGLLIGLFLGLLAAYAIEWRSARRGSAP